MQNTIVIHVMMKERNRRQQNLLEIANCDMPNRQQNNNDMNDSDDQQLRNNVAHDEGESLTYV